LFGSEVGGDTSDDIFRGWVAGPVCAVCPY